MIPRLLRVSVLIIGQDSPVGQLPLALGRRFGAIRLPWQSVRRETGKATTRKRMLRW